MLFLSKIFAKTALTKASFFAVLLAVLFSFTACDLGPDPAADGARFNRRFHYYYDEDCRADAIGAFDCGLVRVLTPSMTVGLRIDSDGLATLSIDGEYFYFLESEYDEGYDPDYGRYYHFYGVYQNTDELTIYKDGLTMAYWDNDHGLVTYYFMYLPD